MLFEDEDDDDDDNLTEYEEWFIYNEFYFPDELRDTGINSMEIELFYHQVYKPVVAEMSPKLHRVMMDQHPSMSREIRPRIVERINRIAPDLAHEWILELFNLMYYAENGFDLRDKYISFERWQKYNMMPDYFEKQFILNFEEYESFSDEEIEDLEDEYVKRRIKEYRYYRQRRSAVHEAFIQPVLKYYSRILNISGDAWVVFAGVTEDMFVEYRERSYHWDSFFKFGFPEEYIDMDAVKYHEILMDTLSKKSYWNYRYGKELEEEDKE